MGSTCSACKCASEDEVSFIIKEDKQRAQCINSANEKYKSDKSLKIVKFKSSARESVTDIINKNPNLENSIIRIQGLIRGYKCKMIYKLLLQQTRNEQGNFCVDEIYETLNCNYLKDLISSNGSYTYKSGSLYDGEWFGGFRHGNGKMKWVDGSFYEGIWNLGYAEGEGLLQLSNGDYKKGFFRYNKLNGYGECYNKDINYRYSGSWLNDLQNGEGNETWEDGSEYIGLFENGKKENFGKYTWKEGSSYLGEWKDNKINGYVS